jgi:HAE1 family hydrophobic/amphiphilic exporter-1
MNITSFCIKRPVTTFMFFAILTLLGLFSSSRMPIDLYPNISIPVINISTSYSGAGPEEVEQLVTIPVEQAISTINKVTSVTSVSQEGRSRVIVYFDWGVNLDEVMNDIRGNLDRVERRLPDSAEKPSIFRYDPSAQPIMTIGLLGNVEESYLRRLAEDEISYQLQKVEGVASVDVRGGSRFEVAVELNRERLSALGMTISQVSSAIRNENIMLPAGNLNTGAGEFLLRTDGELKNAEDLKDIVIQYRNGIPIFLQDLATIEERKANAEYLVRIDGIPGIMLTLQKQSGANTVAVAGRIRKILAELDERYPDLQFRVLNDSSTFISDSVKSVADSAVFGAILAGLVLLFLLHNFSSTLIAGVVMPVSILATLILAYFGKMTLNTISLGGLALGVGMLVDNTVVVIDNISRKLDLGLDPENAASEGTTEMASAISASTLTTICVFFPLLYITGQTGIIFKELAYMVIFSLLCSLLVAITFTPMLCAKYMRKNGNREEQGNSLVKKSIALQKQWEEAYHRSLVKCLQHKKIVVLICVLLFLATLCLWPLIGTELISETDEGIISINITLPPGTKFEETNALMLEFEEIVSKLPELENMEVSVRGFSGGGGNRASMTLRLVDRTKRQRSTNDVMRELQTKLTYPGANIRLRARNSMRMLYSGSDSPIAIDIRGYNQDLARQTAKVVMDRLNMIPGVSNTEVSREEEQPEFFIRINRKRAADLGISTAQISQAIQSSFQGVTATTIKRDGEELRVEVRLREEDRSSLQDLEHVLVTGRNNQLITLASLLQIDLGNSPVSIERTDRERTITVTAALYGRSLSEAMADIKAEMNKISLPAGISLYYSGDYEEQQKGFAELLTALIMALLLVYMIMASQFESFLDPFIIMFSIPFALGGVLLMLFLTDTAFNNQVYIGLIILGGVVVNNAIVLISYYRLLMEKGIALSEAIIEGSVSRLRPILMTTITTVLGLVPLSIDVGSGNNMQAPMARAVIGGLLFSTVLTLILIPVLFMALENSLANLKRRRTIRREMFKVGRLIILLCALLALHQTPAAAEDGKAKVKVLTLAEVINIALENSEEGKILTAQRESILSEYRETQGAKGLKLYTEATTEFTKDAEENSSIGVIAEKTAPLANLWGGKSYADRIAEQNTQINLLSMDLKKNGLILQVINAYLRELLAKRDLELAESNYRRAQYFYEEIKVKSRLGMTSITDETGVEAQLAGAEAELFRAEQNYALARFGLRQYLGFSASTELELAPVGEVDSVEASDLQAALDTALQHRLELKQASLEAERARNLLALAKLSDNLGISLRWTWEKNNLQSGISLSNLKADQSIGEWGVRGNAGVSSLKTPEENKLLLSLRWNFLDGNVRKEQIKQAELLVEQSLEDEKRIRKSIEYQTKEAFFNYLNLERRLRSSELQLRHNRMYLNSLEAKYRAGLASVKDILEAQILLHEAEVRYETIKSDFYLAYIELLTTTGRFSLESLEN